MRCLEWKFELCSSQKWRLDSPRNKLGTLSHENLECQLNNAMVTMCFLCYGSDFWMSIAARKYDNLYEQEICWKVYVYANLRFWSARTNSVCMGTL
jgi:hypothetical protein